MKMTNARLYKLLPAHIRKRDGEQGELLGEQSGPLEAVLSLIADQVDVVDQDISQLYENWFIETCQDWVVPYLGHVIGFNHMCSNESQEGSAVEQGPEHTLLLRKAVANAIRHRKRKGTLALIEELAGDVAGWPARVVEFDELLLVTQSLHHLRPTRGQLVDVRGLPGKDMIRGPFDRLARTVDVRLEHEDRPSGRYHAKSVGAFVCRLPTYALTRSLAYCVEEAGAHCFTFSVLGNDAPLFTAHEPETELTHLATPFNLPLPIGRAQLSKAQADQSARVQTINPEYYGEGKSFAIYVQYKGSTERLIPSDCLIPANLNRWHYSPPEDYLAVDPVLGRIVFPATQLPERVVVSYTYGFGADIGGGGYPRALTRMQDAQMKTGPSTDEAGKPATLERIPVTPKRYVVTDRLTDVLEQWRKDAPPSAIFEIQGNQIFEEQIRVELQNQSLEIRAAQGMRPVIRLVDWQANRPDFLEITGTKQSRFVLDGFMIAGRGLQLKGSFSEVKCVHSTLVPGWALHGDCAPYRPTEASLALMGFQGHLCLSKSISGSIRVYADETSPGLVKLSIIDSMIDATGVDDVALGDKECDSAQVVVTILRSTIVGICRVHALVLAENSIFLSPLMVDRRQEGCLRYCSVHQNSHTPKRFRCQPDLAIAQANTFSAAEVAKQVYPTFVSVRYGSPWYAQLSACCHEVITQGAEGDGEMGVFYHRWHSQRAANLINRLEESVPLGTDVAVIYTT